MNKIRSVFLRNPEDLSKLLETPHPDCLWVLAGEGVATRKYDGICVMLDTNGTWWARKEIKKGKLAPPNWIPVEEDDYTGRKFGWEPIEQSGYWKNSFLECDIDGSTIEPGTYELCGPKINRNPERLEKATLFKHSEAETIQFGPNTHLYDSSDDVLLESHPTYNYQSLRIIVMDVHNYLGWEGIVWHHPDGRMAKLKGRDFK